MRTHIAVAGLLLFLASGNVFAVVTWSACAPDAAAKVSGTTNCEVNDTYSQDNKNAPLIVNEENPMFDSVFNFTTTGDWVFDSKWEYADENSNPPAVPPEWQLEGPSSFGLTITGDSLGASAGVSQLSGTWSIAGYEIGTDLIDVALVFKSGNGTFLTGYLLDDANDVLSGTWSSPFPGRNGNFKGVSHVSAYYRVTEEGNPPAVVPAPGTLLLLGPSLLALGIRRRRS